METGAEIEICREKGVQEERVRAVSAKMAGSSDLPELAELFKVLGDGTRMRILQALYFSELCVCELVEVVGMSQSAISHQLRLLRAAKIVKYRKEGKNVYYSLSDTHIFSLIDVAREHIGEEGV